MEQASPAMKPGNSIVLFFAVLFLNVAAVWAQPPAAGIAPGALSEIRRRPFVFPDIRDGRKRNEVINEICKDRDGALVPLSSADGADFTLAFLNPPKPDPKGQSKTAAPISADALDPSWITSDHKGQMIAYRRTAQGQLRILWMDRNGYNRPGKAMKELLRALSEDSRKSDPPPPSPAPVAPTDPPLPMSNSRKPTILYKEKARYTEEARSRKVQGTVVLNMVFNANGQITDFRVIRGLPGCLTASAIEAARKIRFEPALRDGKPVSVRGNIEFNFSLY